MYNHNLAYYSKVFESLKRDHKKGGAPHKPILLLSLIDSFEKEVYLDNKITITPELIAFFKSNWAKYVTSEHDLRFALPFYHMGTEPFWILEPNEGCELWLQSKGQMRSLSNLQVAIKYAKIDIELTELLKHEKNRTFLRNIILDKYFPNAIFCNNSNEGLSLIENIRKQIIEDSQVEYKTKMKVLKESLDKESFEEEVILRGGIFKREVPRNYAYTCCVSGLRIDVSFNSTKIIEACHIEPFSIAYNDMVTNGITLTPTLHKAFDRGLFTISDNYEVIVSKKISETYSPQGLIQYNRKQLLLPSNPLLYPDLLSLHFHKNNVFEK